MDNNFEHRRYESSLKRLSSSDKLIPENKGKILKFLEFIKANGVSSATQRNIMWSLSTIAIFLGKPFEQANYDDIISLVNKIEDKYKSEKSKKALKAEIRRFYKWLRKTSDYPTEVAWIKLNYRSDKQSRITSGDLLTEGEIDALANATRNPRDRALVLTLYETGCRVGELLSMKIKSVSFDNYGSVIMVNGKTGPRRVRMIKYTRDLVGWLDKHPLKDNPEAPVWISLGYNTKNNLISYAEVEILLKRLAVKIGLGKWDGGNGGISGKARGHYVGKPVNPHSFRHARATSLAKYLREAIMKEHFGWEKDSRMTSVYYHINGSDVDKALLEANGINSEMEISKPLVTRVCANCSEVNSILAHFCKKCNNLLDLSFAWKQKDEAVAKILEELKNDEWFRKRVSEIVTKLNLEKEFQENI